MHDFGLRYCNAKQGKFGWDYSGCSNMKELQIILECGIMLRRQKSDILNEIPSKLREIAYLDKRKIRQCCPISFFDQNHRTGNDRENLLRFFQQSSKAKAPAVCDFIINLINESKEYIIIFAHHHSMLDEICRALDANSIVYVRIDGTTLPENRHQLAMSFQSDGRIRLAVLSLLAAGTGINLTRASIVIFAELFWNPGLLIQAEDRAHRIGQQNTVKVKYLLAKGTVDDLMWPLVHRKLQILTSVGFYVSSPLILSDLEPTPENKSGTMIQKLIDEYLFCQNDEPDNSCLVENEMNDVSLVVAADLALRKNSGG
ncbi:hypothetical protein ACOME3_001331 [Neoechinorhynchus agilis]